MTIYRLKYNIYNKGEWKYIFQKGCETDKICLKFKKRMTVENNSHIKSDN